MARKSEMGERERESGERVTKCGSFLVALVKVTQESQVSESRGEVVDGMIEIVFEGKVGEKGREIIHG
jgi:hypothetical protein